MEKEIVEEAKRKLKVNDEKVIKVLINICKYYKIHDINNIVAVLEKYNKSSH